jgi:hypothetical protein
MSRRESQMRDMDRDEQGMAAWEEEGNCTYIAARCCRNTSSLRMNVELYRQAATGSISGLVGLE